MSDIPRRDHSIHPLQGKIGPVGLTYLAVDTREALEMPIGWLYEPSDYRLTVGTSVVTFRSQLR